MRFKDLIQMPRDRPEPEHLLKCRFAIRKSVDEEMIAFGWASVSVRADGELIEDWHEDIIEPEELEHAAYEYVELYREGGEEHIKGGVAHLVESIVFTPEKLTALGLDADALPIGWWIGLRVTDADVWSKVKSGEYSMFSIEGEAVRVKVGEEGEEDE